MEKQIVIFFDGYFKKLDASVLLENEFDVDFDGQMMVRFLNASDGSVTAKYGYEYRATTSFPDKNFDDNCKNNFLQHLFSKFGISFR